MEWQRAVGLAGEALIFVVAIVWGFFQLRELKRLRLEREARECEAREHEQAEKAGPADR